MLGVMEPLIKKKPQCISAKGLVVIWGLARTKNPSFLNYQKPHLAIKVKRLMSRQLKKQHQYLTSIPYLTFLL
jgi:hypothetical protein